jgi:ribosome-binding factor A
MSKQFSRSRRIADMIQRELAVILQKELIGSEFGLVTISTVDLSPDLKNAIIYVTSLGDDVDITKLIESLNDMSGHYRHVLSKILTTRVTPKLKFKYDTSIQRGSDLSALIDSLNKGEE